MRRLLWATLAAALALPAAAQPDVDPLVGLWRYETRADPAAHGPLTLTLRGEKWLASMGGRIAGGVPVRGELRVTFPGNQGELRIPAPHQDGELHGFWVQPATPAAGPAQAYATPVTLRRLAPGAWRGEVTPLPRSFTLWLKVTRDADGTLIAAFRNPEFNANAGRVQFVASHAGEAVTFESRPQPGRKAVVLKAMLDDGRLRMAYPPLPGEIALARPTPAEAAAFDPRPPGGAPYAYRPPVALKDGWTTARAASVGLDEAGLATLIRAQAAADPAAARPQLIHALLVARHGKLVLDEYFFGFDAKTLHDTRSAAKTFNSVMLGAVMRGDPAFGPQSRIYDVLAGRGPFAHPDPRKAQITLANLMTHTSGLACDDNDDASPGNEETLQRQTGQPDWLKYTLDLPQAHDPGARYAYCSANANLVAGALSARTGTWLPALFDRTVARPLQFGPYAWDLTPTGDGYGGGGVYVRPRDLLKIGQAYLDGGVWHGRRIVSAAWVKASTAPRVEITPQTTGLSAEDFSNVYIRARDGYAWHLNRLKVGDRTFDDYEATGNGGQLLIVVPAVDVAVVITGGNYGQGGVWLRWRDDIVARGVLGAIVR
ncbi:serine hydrolase domain-containing protein [Phenylobacterium sp.]|jgi:CubicO group peptidase (beta-lactamase class C family)|uniref:serine hydrolase domain-containing protein n=1 Tax=Phenylobacterium sp. TaxID=1871053 RepID=UPI002F3E2508